MSRILSFMLIAITGITLASGPSTVGEVCGTYNGCNDTDGVIDSYEYNSGSAHTTGYANFHGFGEEYPYITADDFEITSGSQVEEVLYWMITSNSEPQPTVCDMFLYADADPGPGSQLQSTSSSVASTQTTIPWGSDWVYECMILLDTPFSFDQGTVYWIAPLRDENDLSWYCMVGSDVRGMQCYLKLLNQWGPWSAQGYSPQDMFRVMYEYPFNLNNDTWGSIKALL